MKKIMFLAILLAAMTACKSGGEPADIDTTPALDNNDSRCSLCERFPEYDDCGDVFHNGFTWVSKGELFGIADSNGNLLTPVKWDMVLVIDNHDMLVESGGKTYIIDALGNLTETREKIDWSGEAYD